MVKDTRVVVGSFDSIDRTKTVLRDLETGGYPKEDITLYANENLINEIRNTPNIDAKTNEVDDQSVRTEKDTTKDEQSFWERTKDLFTMDDTDDKYLSDQEGPRDGNILSPYREDINNGHIVVVVNNYRDDVQTSGTNTTTPAGETNVHTDGETNVMQSTVREPRDEDLTDEKVQLKEERLHVDKEEVQTGEVHVSKAVKHDTETVDVPVEREEVVIERKPVTGENTRTTDTDFNEETETIDIPVREEKVTVDKEPVVKEEVEIKKVRDKDVETVSEDVKREELDVDREGHTGAEGTVEDLDSRE